MFFLLHHFGFFFWPCALTAETLTKKAQKVDEIAEGLNPPRCGWAPSKRGGSLCSLQLNGHFWHVPPGGAVMGMGCPKKTPCPVENSLLLALSLPFINQDSHSRGFVEVGAWLGSVFPTILWVLSLSQFYKAGHETLKVGCAPTINGWQHWDVNSAA